MIDFSFSEKLARLKDIILSTPFFSISLIVGIILFIIMIIGIKNNRKVPKLVFIISWIFVLIFIIVRYNTSLVYVFDRLFGKIVEQIYFPSVTVYTLMLIISNVIFIISYFKKSISSLFKIINTVASMELNFFFILILDTIVKNNIDIYSELTVYSNTKMLILLEFSMFLFLSWMVLLIILLIIKKYAVKTVLVNIFKEEDYEIVNVDLEAGTEVVELDTNATIEIDELKKDDIEILDI